MISQLSICRASSAQPTTASTYGNLQQLIQRFFFSCGAGRVGSGAVRIITGRVGSGHEVFKMLRVGSGHDPGDTGHGRVTMTRELFSSDLRVWPADPSFFKPIAA